MYQPSLFGCVGFGPSTSSAGASRVRTSVRPEEARALRAAARVYGARCFGLSAKSDPLGWSLRTCLLSACAALTGFSLRWNESATPAGHWWLVLGRSGPRTNGIGSGSWPTAWQTPKTMDQTGIETNHRHNWEKETDNQTLTLLGQAKSWLTPTETERQSATSAEPYVTQSGTVRAMRPDGKSSNMGLTAQVAFPTPQASDANGGKGMRLEASETGAMPDGCKATISLRDSILRQWATPKAEERQQTNSGDDYAALSAQVKTWPTPTDPAGSTGGVNSQNPRGQHQGCPIVSAVKQEAMGLWPTPDTGTTGSTDATNRTGGPSLTGLLAPANPEPLWEIMDSRGHQQVTVHCDGCGLTHVSTDPEYLTLPCPICKCIQSGTVTFHYLDLGPPVPVNPSIQGKPRGSLNSAWVRSLLGWPDEYWTRLEEAVTEYHLTALPRGRTRASSVSSATVGSTTSRS